MFRCFFLYLILSHHLYGLYVLYHSHKVILTAASRSVASEWMRQVCKFLSFVSDVTTRPICESCSWIGMGTSLTPRGFGCSEYRPNVKVCVFLWGRVSGMHRCALLWGCISGMFGCWFCHQSIHTCSSPSGLCCAELYVMPCYAL